MLKRVFDIGLILMSKSQWYEIKKLESDVSRILETHVSADWRCNIWYVRGRDRDLIIDTGMGLRRIAEDITLLTERPVLAVCTHSHHDHAGGLCQFKKRLGHPAEAEIFANPTRNKVVAELLDASVVKKLPYEGFNPDQWCYDPAPLTQQVVEGDIIDLGDRILCVVHLPGHSPGSVALWEEATGTIFTGDALYEGTLYDHLYHSMPQQLCESLKRLKELPIKTVHAGHFKSFSGDRMKIIIDEYLNGQRSMLCPIR
jgi:glyoxylase-like metal-dependent hydrolase (beta-lactamase superfamily II)